MQIKKTLVSSVLAGIIALETLPCSAAMITARATKIDESYTVDTSSLYVKDKNNFNVGVYYTDNIKNKTNPYVYKFSFIDNKWYVLEKTTNPSKDDIKVDDTHYWGYIENGSIAQDVLRVTLPYVYAK